MTNIGIILGSTRPGRVGHQVAEWVAEQGGRHAGIKVEVVDIEEYGLSSPRWPPGLTRSHRCAKPDDPIRSR